MQRESDDKKLFNWLEDIWEEIEIQFYGITGAILFFILIYFIFHPSWMKNMVDLL